MKSIKMVANAGRASITLSKPPLNIFDADDLVELAGVFKRLKNEQSIGIITIESDQRVFSAGVDIAGHSREKVKEMLETFHDVFFAMLELRTPTISLVKSGCIGGGCELALFGDFVLASEAAYFSQPEIKLGCFPPLSAVYFPFITGHKNALEIMLTGDKVFAGDAHRLGLVNRVFPGEEFDTGAEKFIGAILSNPANAVKTALGAYKRLNYPGLREKIKLSEKIYLEEVEHDTISLKNLKK